jgi:hypothetical protein
MVILAAIYVTSFSESPPRNIAPTAAFDPAEQGTNSTLRFTIQAISSPTPLSDINAVLQVDGGGYGSPVRSDLVGAVP